jgi:lipoprotein signal peptidase
MINYLKKIIRSDTPESSKRFIGIISFICVAFLSILGTFTKYQCPEYMYNALCLISGGGLGLTVIEKIFQKKPNSEEKIEI